MTEQELDASQQAAKQIAEDEAARENGNNTSAVVRVEQPPVEFSTVWRWAPLPKNVNVTGLWGPKRLHSSDRTIGLGRACADMIVAADGVFWAIIGNYAYSGVPLRTNPKVPQPPITRVKRENFELQAGGFYQVWIRNPETVKRRPGRPRRQSADAAQ